MHAIRFALCCASVWLAGFGSAAAAPPALVYAQQPGAVVVEFSERPGELASAEASISLRIYGDGRFVTHRPAGMRGAGDHEGRLTPAELQALLRRFSERGVLELDSASLRRARTPRAGRLARETSDPSEFSLVVRASRADPAASAGARSAATATETRIAGRGLRAAARAEPSDSALAGLAQSCAELRGMIDTTGVEAAQ